MSDVEDVTATRRREAAGHRWSPRAGVYHGEDIFRYESVVKHHICRLHQLHGALRTEEDGNTHFCKLPPAQNRPPPVERIAFLYKKSSDFLAFIPE